MTRTVHVPEQFEPIFADAEKIVGGFFAKMKMDPTKGTIEIDNDRYILIRGESIFVTLRKKMVSEFGPEVADAFLYDLAKTIGHSDAETFAKKLKLTDPIKRLSAGPVHFSHSGWAFVDILPESQPTPDENYLLVYHHPNTFESAQQEYKKKKSDHPVCIFSAGYSAGWCSYSFGIDVDAQEINCVACGDAHCTFVMAPPAKLAMRVEQMKGKLK
jgi:predicted hydrocarbon binding protein